MLLLSYMIVFYPLKWSILVIDRVNSLHPSLKICVKEKIIKFCVWGSYCIAWHNSSLAYFFLLVNHETFHIGNCIVLRSIPIDALIFRLTSSYFRQQVFFSSY